jgi:hypothetical protein
LKEEKDASLSAVKQGKKKDASLSAVKQGERRVALTKRFIGKTTTQEKVKTVIKQRQRSVHRMVGSGTREAQGRVRRGGLLDEGADCECEVGFAFTRRQEQPLAIGARDERRRRHSGAPTPRRYAATLLLPFEMAYLRAVLPSLQRSE